MCSTFVPMQSKSGRARSSASAFPPTMIDSVASRAPCGPPETGASSMSMPRSPSRAAIARVAVGSMVLVSMTSVPGRAPCTTPSSPSRTCSTSAVPVSMVKIASHSAASAAGVSAVAAPRSTSGSRDAGRRAQTVSS